MSEDNADNIVIAEVGSMSPDYIRSVLVNSRALNTRVSVLEDACMDAIAALRLIVDVENGVANGDSENYDIAAIAREAITAVKSAYAAGLTGTCVRPPSPREIRRRGSNEGERT